MTHWDHGGNPAGDDTSPATASRNARIGMALFVVYLLFYAGFVLIAAFAPAAMANRPWAGINLAIWYGFALLGAALLVAMVYSWVCRARDGS
jgi:uncharacterized membrane protein (DUF485 family)